MLFSVTVGFVVSMRKLAVSVVVPAGVVTETSLVPGVASEAIVMLAVIWIELSTVKLLTVIPEPKLTTLAPANWWPVIVISIVSP